MRSHTSRKRDHSTLTAKVAMRRTLIATLPRPLTILEAYGGTGELWKHCYDYPGLHGLVIERDPRKVEALAVQRPRWMVVEGDCTRLLAAGLAPWLPFDLLDLDAHGSPLACLEALLSTPRALSQHLDIVATDGIGFAIRRGSVPAPLEPSLMRHGRQQLLRHYPHVLHEWLTERLAMRGYRLQAFRWRVAGSAGQLYHWQCRVQHDAPQQ